MTRDDITLIKYTSTLFFYKWRIVPEARCIYVNIYTGKETYLGIFMVNTKTIDKIIWQAAYGMIWSVPGRHTVPRLELVQF